MAKVPLLKANNGTTVPMLGFGAYFGLPSEFDEAEVQKSMESAIAVGYRHIDTAHLYQTETVIGRAIKNKIADGTVRREDLYITSKVNFDSHEPGDVMPSVMGSLKELQMDYIDLYLIHTPFAAVKGTGLPNPTMSTTNDHVKTWKALEECVKQGLVRSIGLSNFNKRQVQNILDNCEIKPVTNQVEVQPYFSNEKIFQFCKENDIFITAYTTLGQPHPSWAPQGWVSPLKDETLISIGKKYSKSPAQVALKFQIQRGIVALAKAMSTERQKQNIEIFDFDLSNDDMKAIHAMNKDARINKFPPFLTHKDYPFNEEY